jgi:hypothetical protein
MTRDDYAVIGRALLDTPFRTRLMTDFDGTIAAEKMSVSASLAAQLKSIDPRVADQIGRVIGASLAPPSNELGEDELEQVAGGLAIGGMTGLSQNHDVNPNPLPRSLQALPFSSPGNRVDSTW